MGAGSDHDPLDWTQAVQPLAKPRLISHLTVTRVRSLIIHDPKTRIRIFPSRIPDPDQRIKCLYPKKKLILNSRKYDPRCPGSGFFPHPGARGQKSKKKQRIPDRELQHCKKLMFGSNPVFLSRHFWPFWVSRIIFADPDPSINMQ